MEIERIKIDQLRQDPKNARTHSEANLKAIAASLEQFGQRKPIVVSGDNIVAAGNGTLAAAQSIGWLEIDIVRVPTDWDENRLKAFALADNRSAELASWSPEILQAQIEELTAVGFDVESFGFEVFSPIEETTQIEETDIPTLAPRRVSMGDVWQLGTHRLMCGDSTNTSQVTQLLAGEKAQLLHADPPYGMGKEGVGVANDNLYKEKLDKFQMDWWNTFRPFLEDNASAYVWGTAPDLWRLWYVAGLENSEPLTFRNEIIWAKNIAQGQESPMHRMFPTGSERALFFMIGQQGFNTNSDNYWEGWEPIRSYLETEMKKMGWTTKDINRITGTSSMAQHWITKSQWLFMNRSQYSAIQNASFGKAFLKSFDDLEAQYLALKHGNDEIKDSFYSSKAFFDNSHDSMTDVWNFNVVYGEERHGHATPKPVEMMARVMKSSLPKGGLCLEPFGGSGATLIGAEQTNRRCYTMELQADYCDVIIQRWENLTGQKAELANASR